MKMTRYRIMAVVAALTLTACTTVSYRLVVPGVQTLGSLRITAGPGWNVAPTANTPAARSNSRTWTRDGLLLDRMIIIPAVADGDALFVSRDKAAALPTFRSDMLPNEIEELVESSIVKYYGEGNTAVSTSNLRPQQFGTLGGFLFDMEAAVTESPNYKGIAGAFIYEEKLYMSIFLAATPNYYDKHIADATTVIKSMATSEPTIGRF